MARFGLSPYSNPIEAGIDSFAKLSNVFNQRDRLELDRQDAGQRQHLRDQEIQRGQQQQQEYEAAAPERDLAHQEKRMKAAQSILAGPIDQGTVEMNQAMAEGREWKPSDDALAAGVVLHDITHYSNDMGEAMQQAKASIGLARKLSEATPALAKHMQENPKGMINNQTIPGIEEDINAALGNSKLLGGKKAVGVIYDTEKNIVVPVLVGEDGQPAPAMDKQMSISELKSLVQHNATAANYIIATRGVLHGADDATVKKVTAKAEELHKNLAAAEVMDEIDEVDEDNKQIPASEQAKQFIKLMNAKGISVSKADAEERFRKPTKPRNLQKLTVGAGTDKEQEILVNPDAEDETGNAKVVFKGEPREVSKTRREGGGSDLALEMRRERMDAKKEKDSQARYDKLYKESMVNLRKDPAWKDSSNEEIEVEADRVARSRIDGKPAGPSPERAAKATKIQPLKDDFSAINDGMFGTDKTYKIESALKKGWSKEEVTQAAKGTPMADAVKSYDFNKTPKTSVAEKREIPSKSKAKESNDMPNPVQYTGKILRDNQTGKRYKSDGKRWNEIA